MTHSYTSFSNGRSVSHDGNRIALISPIDLSTVAHIIEADADIVSDLIRDAQASFLAHRKATLLERSTWLQNAAALIQSEAESIIRLIIEDTGKPRKAATFEVARSSHFLRACAAAILQLAGEVIPLAATAAGARHFGYTKHVPYGVVAAITPFNAPANLLVQKVGPAIAAGNAVVVKPHLAGTRAALRIAELFSASGLPAGLFNVATGDRSPATLLVSDERVSAVTFTGGTAAGHALARAAGAKKMVAELGSNAANIVLADADIEAAAMKIASAAFEASGQQCISAQRIIVATEVHDAFVDAFHRHARGLKMGDPNDPESDLGPMISLASAQRIGGMLDDTIERGGKYVLEPRRHDCYVSPGIVVDAPRESAIWKDEAFGPVAVIRRAAGIDEAIALANDSPFGLQGAVFTQSMDAAFRFAEEFEVGSLWVNEASRFRLDTYPFGGVKNSGFGREGVRYAIEEMSQLKFVGFHMGK
jgi:acyl-CoA reductase-like NAD-dependent aldehyde dehydrogenase